MLPPWQQDLIHGEGQGSAKALFGSVPIEPGKPELIIGRDATGKRRSKSVYGKTKKAVSDKLTKSAAQKIDGMLIVTSKLTAAEFLTLWLETVVKVSNRVTTHKAQAKQ